MAAIFQRKPVASLKRYRSNGRRAALVFLHGFTGDTERTWGDFPRFLCEVPSLANWDVYALGYASSLRIDVPIWEADPSLTTLSLAFRTSLSQSPLSDAKILAIAAHSMGGLIVQRALVDDANLLGRTTHVALFGTPSGGLVGARRFSWLKRQIRDMAADRPFIQALRADWREKFSNNLPFQLRVVAGERDVFVPGPSSLEPFPNEFQRAVAGNHLEIVKPREPDDPSVRLLIDLLNGNHPAPGIIDGARLALEVKNFHKVVADLLPRASELDDAAIVNLALALDAIGDGMQAMEILENRFKDRKSPAEIYGVLGGRVKRRWLGERSAADLVKATTLYSRGLELAEAEADSEQGYYQAINLAFLETMSSAPGTSVPVGAMQLAQRALGFCEKAPRTFWRLATEGEAQLVLGDLLLANQLYGQALAENPDSRSIDSMYMQAIQLAMRTHGEGGARAIETTFKMASRSDVEKFRAQ